MNDKMLIKCKSIKMKNTKKKLLEQLQNPGSKSDM